MMRDDSSFGLHDRERLPTRAMTKKISQSETRDPPDGYSESRRVVARGVLALGRAVKRLFNHLR